MQTLATDEIAKSYRGRRVVNGVSLHINQAEVVGLLGPNGAGKTTSFYMIVGLVPPDSGRILVDGQDISNVPMYLRARNYRHQLSSAGALSFSQAECGRKHYGCAGSAAYLMAGAPAQA